MFAYTITQIFKNIYFIENNLLFPKVTSHKFKIANYSRENKGLLITSVLCDLQLSGHSINVYEINQWKKKALWVKGVDGRKVEILHFWEAKKSPKFSKNIIKDCNN